jgi:hypothetical protein
MSGGERVSDLSRGSVLPIQRRTFRSPTKALRAGARGPVRNLTRDLLVANRMDGQYDALLGEPADHDGVPRQELHTHIWDLPDRVRSTPRFRFRPIAGAPVSAIRCFSAVPPERSAACAFVWARPRGSPLQSRGSSLQAP